MKITTKDSLKRKQMLRKIGKARRSVASWALTILLFAFGLFMLSPFYYVLVSTFKDAQEVTFSPMSLPKHWNFDRYIDAWNQMDYPRAFMNTINIVIPSIAISTLLSTMCAYALVRCPNRLNQFLFWLFLSGMLIPGAVNLVSLYKLMLDLELNNTHFGLIILNCGGVGMMTLFMLRNFLNSPDVVEIEQAAEIDGCSILHRFFYIALPLTKPIVATNIIINLMGMWNDYLTPSLFLSVPSKYTLMIAVYQNVGQFTTDWLTMFNMLVLALLPLTIMYIFLQINDFM